MGHFIPLNLTSVAIFSPGHSNMNSLIWWPVQAGVEDSLTVRVKGAPSLIKLQPQGLVLQRGGISRLSVRLTSSIGIGKSLFDKPLLLLSNVRGKCVHRRPYSPEVTGRETVCSDHWRAGTKYSDLQHEGCRLCYAQSVSALTSGTGALA